jgi:hypothetical protein
MMSNAREIRSRKWCLVEESIAMVFDVGYENEVTEWHLAISCEISKELPKREV